MSTQRVKKSETIELNGRLNQLSKEFVAEMGSQKGGYTPKSKCRNKYPLRKGSPNKQVDLENQSTYKF